MRWLLFPLGVAVGYLLNKREDIQAGLEWWADQLDPQDDPSTEAVDEEEIIIVTDGDVEEEDKVEQSKPDPDLSAHNQVKDDLKKIKGIGPKTEAILHKAGITSYAELAKADIIHLRQLLDDAGMKIVNPEGWPAQASEFSS